MKANRYEGTQPRKMLLTFSSSLSTSTYFRVVAKSIHLPGVHAFVVFTLRIPLWWSCPLRSLLAFSYVTVSMTYRCAGGRREEEKNRTETHVEIEKNLSCSNIYTVHHAVESVDQPVSPELCFGLIFLKFICIIPEDSSLKCVCRWKDFFHYCRLCLLSVINLISERTKSKQDSNFPTESHYFTSLVTENFECDPF